VAQLLSKLLKTEAKLPWLYVNCVTAGHLTLKGRGEKTTANKMEGQLIGVAGKQLLVD